LNQKIVRSKFAVCTHRKSSTLFLANKILMKKSPKLRTEAIRAFLQHHFQPVDPYQENLKGFLRSLVSSLNLFNFFVFQLISKAFLNTSRLNGVYFLQLVGKYGSKFKFGVKRSFSDYPELCSFSLTFDEALLMMRVVEPRKFGVIFSGDEDVALMVEIQALISVATGNLNWDSF
jgi:hypothetical protein